MKASKENTLDKILFSVFQGAIVVGMIAGCQNLEKSEPQRDISNVEEGAFASRHPSCPDGTQLALFQAKVQVEECLRNYRHDETAHGVRRQRYCHHGQSSHDRFLRNNMYPAKVFKDQSIQYRIPTSNPRIQVELGTNASFYSLKGVVAAGEKASPSEVLQAIRSIDGLDGATVALFRCECKLNPEAFDESVNRCQQKLASANLKYSYEVVPQNMSTSEKWTPLEVAK